jgi:hypothetical protein
LRATKKGGKADFHSKACTWAEFRDPSTGFSPNQVFRQCL